MSVAYSVHAMHSLNCRGPQQIVPCTMHHQSTLSIVLLTRSLAHHSCSWLTQLDQAVLAVCTCSLLPIVSAKLKQSQLFERGVRLAKSKLSNELEHGGTYGMTYDT